MAKRRKYDKEFKREAVRLVLEDGRPAAEVERNLGTGSNMVSRWVREFQKDPQYSFPGQGKMREPEQEVLRIAPLNRGLRVPPLIRCEKTSPCSAVRFFYA
ncbi:MAG: transposase [Desulfatiglandales bacterium]